MKKVIAGIFAGVASAILGIFLVGYSSAVAIPKAYSGLFSGWRMYVWELVVVQFFSYGIAILTLTFLVAKTLKLNPWAVAAIAFISCEAFLIIVSWPHPLIYGPHVAVVAICAALGAVAAHRLQKT